MEASADASMDSGHAAGECIIVLKAAAFVSSRGCLLQRGTCLWRWGGGGGDRNIFVEKEREEEEEDALEEKP